MGKHNKGDHTWTMGITQFSDMTPEEFKSYISCGRLKHTPSKTVFDAPKDWNKTAASSIDWVAQGAVTNVKNQGQCGSCWAFSSTGAIEGSMFLSTGTLDSYSEQQLVDCSKMNSGCNGGLMDYAFQYVETAPLMTESAYPYTARQGTCQYVSSQGKGKVKAFKDVQRDTSGSQLMAAVAKGPVSVAVEA